MDKGDEGMDMRRQEVDRSGTGDARRGPELSVVRPVGQGLPRPPSVFPPQDTEGQVELSRLVDARDHVALLIDRHGAQYLPLFVRLDEEVARHQASESLVERARRLARRADTRADAA